MSKEKLLEEMRALYSQLERVKFQLRQCGTDLKYTRAAGENACGEVLALQEEVRALAEENQRLKGAVPDFVRWWRGFNSYTRDGVYEKLGRSQENRPVNSANATAQAILEWVARASNRSTDSIDGVDWKKAAEERSEEICKLKLDKEDLEQAVKSLQKGMHKNIECAMCHHVYPTGSGWVCDKCVSVTTLHRGEDRKRMGELERELVKVTETAFNFEAATKSLESQNRHLKTNLTLQEETIRTAQAALKNPTVTCHSCGKVSRVNLESMVCGKCHEVVKKHAHYAVDEEAERAKFHDEVIDRILDILEPEFYDPSTPAAQSGYDYEAMFRGIQAMKDKLVPNEDFGERIAKEIAHGLTDEEILDGIAEDDHVDLVALVRTLMEKRE